VDESLLLTEQDRNGWTQLLKEISSELGMVATLVDPAGKILLHVGDYTDACIRVRKREQTLTFICGQTSQVLMKQAEKTRQPVVDVCQIGLCKMVIPLFRGERFLGAVTSCSRALVGEELDPFLVAQELGIEEEEARTLIESVPKVDEEKVQEVASQWADRVRALVQKTD
jgi:ligand-binding sensor protein